MSNEPTVPIKQNPFAELLGMRILTCAHGHCHSELDAGEGVLNPNGVVHGGAVYTLADTSMGTALSMALDEGEHCATIEIKISYYAPARAGRLACEARITHRARRFAFLEAEVRQEHRIIARASGTFVISRTHHEHADAAQAKTQ